MTSKSQKERAQKHIPGGAKKKGELLKASKWHQKVKKKERNKLSPEERKQKKNSSDLLATSFVSVPRSQYKQSTCSYQESYRFSTTNTNYHNCSPQLSENIHEISEIQWNVMPPRGWSTSLIPTLIATEAATISPSIWTIRKSAVPRKAIRKRLWFCFAFYRTLRKCVKALSENYPTKYGICLLTIRNAKKLSESFSGH